MKITKPTNTTLSYASVDVPHYMAEQMADALVNVAIAGKVEKPIKFKVGSLTLENVVHVFNVRAEYIPVNASVVSDSRFVGIPKEDDVEAMRKNVPFVNDAVMRRLLSADFPTVRIMFEYETLINARRN